VTNLTCRCAWTEGAGSLSKQERLCPRFVGGSSEASYNVTWYRLWSSKVCCSIFNILVMPCTVSITVVLLLDCSIKCSPLLPVSVCLLVTTVNPTKTARPIELCCLECRLGWAQENVYYVGTSISHGKASFWMGAYSGLLWGNREYPARAIAIW